MIGNPVECRGHKIPCKGQSVFIEPDDSQRMPTLRPKSLGESAERKDCQEVGQYNRQDKEVVEPAG